MQKLIQTGALALIFAASAPAVRVEKNMSLELANQIAGASVAACNAAGHNVSARNNTLAIMEISQKNPGAGNLDEQCALAGIAMVQDLLK